MAGNSDAANTAESSPKTVVGEMVANVGDLFNQEPRNPADSPVPDYNCPVANCGAEKVCEQVNVGDPITGDSRAHIERNACNKCPSSPPVPRYSVRGDRNHPRRILYFEDHTGRRWQPDSDLTAPIFHGDAGFGHRTHDSMTFRLDFGLSQDERGWQCRYYKGQLDDTSTDMGTYDYADAPSSNHTEMDVNTHLQNPHYAPNLTERY